MKKKFKEIIARRTSALFLAVTLVAGMLFPALTAEAGWEKDSVGWWFRGGNGYPASIWMMIDGNWYWFNGDGYMQTGWQNIGGTWYYMYDSGAMATGWVNVGGTWYYMYDSGAMATGWVNVGGTWYYMQSDGSMVSNQWIGNYYLTASGSMAVSCWIGNYYVGSDGMWISGYGTGQWVQDGNGWWYRHNDGSYPSGKWENIHGKWYYFDINGYMQTGWQNIGGTWYYMYDSGAMASDVSIGGCYVDENGAWILPMELFENLDFYDGSWGEFGAHVNKYQGMVKAIINSSISLSDYFGDGPSMVLEKRIMNDDVLENGLSATNQLYTITFQGPSVTGTGGARTLYCTVSSPDGVSLVYNEISYY